MSFLAANLAWIQSPSLRRRLLLPVEALAVPASVWPTLPEAPEMLLIGAASPEGITAALATGARIHLWDLRAANLRKLLEELDLQEALRREQLRLYADLDLLALPSSLPQVHHPWLSERYNVELRCLQQPLPAGRALLVDSGLLQKELVRALEQEGMAVWRWEITVLPAEELDRQALMFGAQWVIAINHRPGLAEAVERLSTFLPMLQLRVWEIDPALDPVRAPELPVPRTRIYSYRREQVQHFRAAGYATEYLPLATDPSLRTPQPAEPAYAAPVTFVGRSLIPEAERYRRRLLQDLEAAGAAQPAQLLNSVLTRQRNTTSYVVPELFGVATAGLQLPDRAYDPLALVAEIAAAEFRINTLASLHGFAPEVWGDAGWKLLEPHGVRWRGPAGTHTQLPHIYSNGGIHIDIGRLYQMDMVTLRVFEVLACGGFLIAQHSEPLAELFVVGQELESWSTREELREKINWYLVHPERRAEIAARGRARVCRDHTIRQRLQTMIR